PPLLPSFLSFSFLSSLLLPPFLSSFPPFPSSSLFFPLFLFSLLSFSSSLLFPSLSSSPPLFPFSLPSLPSLSFLSLFFLP
ncbi:hypothetical protein ACXWRW_11245, partial [Streptococcus pyogenes]